MRKTITVNMNSSSAFKKRLLSWAKKNEVFVLLDSNDYNKNSKTHNYDFIAAFGVADSLTTSVTDAFERLEAFYKKRKDWIFGHFTYDLKNGLERLTSEHVDNLFFPDMFFFQPEFVILSKKGQAEMQVMQDISDDSAEEVLSEIHAESEKMIPYRHDSFSMNRRFTQQEYLDTVNKLKKHIKRGDIYEMNFCQEFYSNSSIDPYFIYYQLNELSPGPFSCFYKLNDKFLLSSSPERFLKKRGDRVISQPIKGTSPRGKNKKEDEFLKQQLANDVKERAENVMIVDLVRNDLSRIAKDNTVNVDELFGIYSFEQVYQMISTVSAEINEEDIIECVKQAFPMGSMTGAPKISAMKLIEKYERTKRGLYSGSVGYFSPEGDFDL
ncbi:MAG: anthranilate synthase component I family protein, partial [Bacteroidota bacterium]